MIVSYEHYSELSLKQIDRALGGDAEMLLFFLFTQFDDQAQKELRQVAKDLDALTGNWAAALLFAPPPPGARKPADRLDGHMNAADEPRLWADINRSLTDNVYAIAREFSVSLDDLPGILFVGRDSTEFAYLRLKNGSLLESYPRIRRIVSAWYEANRARLTARRPSKLLLNRMQSDFIGEELIPGVREVLRRRNELSSEAGLRLLKLLHRLRRHPAEWQPLVEAWREMDLSVNLRGHELTAESLRSATTSIAAARACPGGAESDAASFPAAAIRAVDAEVRIGSFIRSANAVRDQVGGWLDFVSKLRVFVGLP